MVLSPTTVTTPVETTTSTVNIGTYPDQTTSTSTTSTTVPVVYGRPTHLTIEKIGVNDQLTPVNLGAEGEFEAEPMTVAWYQGSVWPGQPGPMLIAAHVAWKKLGPDRFARLTELRPGDQFQLANELGETFDYTATDLYEVSKDEDEFFLFMDDVVYGQVGTHALWLITCGGDLLPTGHFDSNIFVRATITPEEG
jgi:sortase (surface protein transpeptidase)